MEWISNNLQIVIFIAGVIAYWVNQSRKGWTEGDEAGGPQKDRTQAEFEPTAADNEDRIRQIQDEIRRKIAERSGAEPRRSSASRSSPSVSRSVEEPPPLHSDKAGSMAMTRQTRMMNQLAEAERAKAAAKEKLHAVWDRPSVIAAKRTASRRQAHELSVRETLQDRKELRRAWIMREILDQPVGLR